MDREYEVIGPHSVMGTAPGDKFKSKGPLANEGMLVAAGHLKVIGAKKLDCGECSKKFDTHDDLVAHYEAEHGGVEPPEPEEA